jgi:hypothetical protein
MFKKIKSIQQLDGHNHPALGPLFSVIFEDGSKDLIYAETFFEQDIEWDFYNPQTLVGKEIEFDMGKNYYNY